MTDTEAATVRDEGDGRYSVAGEMTVASVTRLRSRGLMAFAGGRGPVSLDFGQVTRADSGGLALLVDWLAWAQAAGRAMSFTSLPASILGLARLSDVEDLLLGAH